MWLILFRCYVFAEESSLVRINTGEILQAVGHPHIGLPIKSSISDRYALDTNSECAGRSLNIDLLADFSAHKS